MSQETIAFRIHHAPKETVELLKKTKKRWEQNAREEKNHTWFNWSMREEKFRNFSGEIFSAVLKDAAMKNCPDITLLKSGSKTLLSFLGTPEEAHEKLAKILDEIERKVKLRSFK